MDTSVHCFLADQQHSSAEQTYVRTACHGSFVLSPVFGFQVISNTVAVCVGQVPCDP